jgi:hypothetical protein
VKVTTEGSPAQALPGYGRWKLRDGWPGARNPARSGQKNLTIPNGLGYYGPRRLRASALNAKPASCPVFPGATGRTVDVMAGSAKIAIVGAGRAG